MTRGGGNDEEGHKPSHPRRRVSSVGARRWIPAYAGMTERVAGMTELGHAWHEVLMLVIYAKSAKDSIPGHILKSIKEAMEDA